MIPKIFIILLLRTLVILRGANYKQQKDRETTIKSCYFPIIMVPNVQQKASAIICDSPKNWDHTVPIDKNETKR
jgi:hypothetical protein